MHESLAPALHRFAAVAHDGHLTRAAERIGVPQPTLSRAIARLEDELGVALFHRVGRGLRLTPAGRTLLPRAEAALAELAAAAAELAGDTDPATGRVAFGFLGTLGTEVVPRILRGFRDAHPRVRIELVQNPHAELLDRVRDGTVDLALTSPMPDEPGLTATALAEEELRLVVPAGHRLAGRPAVDLAEVADEPFLLFARGYGLHGTVEAWCEQAGFRPRRAFEGGETGTLRGLAGAGLGVALLPLGPAVPGVVQLPVRAPRTVRTLGMVHAAGDRPTPPVGDLRAFVAEHGPRLLSHGLPSAPWNV
ncbi:transcriptional regulator [Pseudonocardia ammonioxydans]|uniref:Transcriptional regulator n=1 Tax=Pseudonocardia ammonioxydans TaxID=260086 RepID=A0A1I4XY86_PSUAM|nr:LysR family transcriptional regulator [Pseudonocardia ammonioxydans]SFN30804.1 transcriptional regulator [Pseudonocardia ammonioxydans]